MNEEGPHAALENTFNRRIKDQLFRSVAHGVSAFTRRHTQFIAGASTVGPSTVTRVYLRGMHKNAKKGLPKSFKSNRFSL